MLLQSLGVAPGTWKNKDSQFKSFLAFCNTYGLQCFPTSGDALVLYVTHLAAVRGLSWGTIRNHLASIKTYHASYGLWVPSPTEYHPLKMALAGARRFLARPQQQKFPITVPICQRILASCSFYSPFRSLVLLMFLTSLRLASVLPTKSTFIPFIHLSWGNLTLGNTSVTIAILKTKTIQCLEKTLRFTVLTNDISSACLLHHLNCLRSITSYPSAPSDPVFSYWTGSTWSPLTRPVASTMLAGVLSSISLNPSCFGWSSFRRGSASEYLLATGDAELLRIHGDWASSVYQKYLSVPAERRSKVTKTLQTLLIEF